MAADEQAAAHRRPLRDRSLPPAASIGGLLFAAPGATDADVVTVLTHGREGLQARATDLVVDRTGDGGQTWTPSVIRLP